MEGLEGLRVGLGPGIIMMYLFQGLFHPARRVRDIYWKIYNLLYIGSADSMVAYFPSLPCREEPNKYRRSELEISI